MNETNTKYDRKIAEKQLFSENTETICQTLLEITFNDSDWQWLQNTLLNLLENNRNLDVKRLTITCLGHTARIHRNIDKDKVVPILENYLLIPELNGTVLDTFDDFDVFLEHKQEKPIKL